MSYANVTEDITYGYMSFILVTFIQDSFLLG